MSDLQTWLNIAVAIVILGGIVFTAGSLRASLVRLSMDVEEIKGDVKLMVDMNRRISVVEEKVENLEKEQIRMRNKIHDLSNNLVPLLNKD